MSKGMVVVAAAVELSGGVMGIWCSRVKRTRVGWSIIFIMPVVLFWVL